MSRIHIIPTLEDNYTYLIENGEETLLIDCGEAKPVLDFLKSHKLVPTQLLCTHHHGDHIAGIDELKKNYPDMTIYAPEKDRGRIAVTETGLSDGQILTIGDLSVICIETPGHTLNHLCYYVPQLNAAFTGDALFSLGCGRLFEGTADDLFTSMQKLKALPETTNIYCGHEYTLKNMEFSMSVEPDNTDLQEYHRHIQKLRSFSMPTIPVTLDAEKKLNLFLKADTVEKIAQLRQLRDTF